MFDGIIVILIKWHLTQDVDWSCWNWRESKTICWWRKSSSETKKDWSHKKRNMRFVIDVHERNVILMYIVITHVGWFSFW